MGAAWRHAHPRHRHDSTASPIRTAASFARTRLEPLFRHEPLAAPKVFRIYRDVRFSKDKSPYKTHIGGYIAVDGTGQGPSAAAALYFHVGAEEVFVAAGQYMMDGEQLARFRQAVVDDRQG